MNELLVEKYRPTKLDDVILADSLKEKFKEYIDQQYIPHILLSGSPGIGKTTIAKILAKHISNDYLFVCASDHNSVEDIRGKVKGFCVTMGFSKFKIVILDECDAISLNGQMMLRNLMEEFHETCRFILTCNFGEKVLDAVKSRCQSYDLTPPDMKSVALRCVDILKLENIKCESKDDIKALVKRSYPDIRKVINNLQKMIVNNEFKYEESKSLEDQDILIELLKTGNLKQIYKDVLGPGCDYVSLYRILFDRASEISEPQKIEIMLIVGDFHKYHGLVVDHQIHFKTCLLTLAKLLFKK
jgi:DNA polymerase III delta prime subunit